MNYRHIYHAGNFADLLKHALLTRILRAMTTPRGALTIIDTHAGAGVYDLLGDAALRTGEADAGVGRLLRACRPPIVFNDLLAAVRRVNEANEARFYPGSPVIIAAAMRTQDRYIACEMRADDHAALKAALPREMGAEILRVDGWTAAADRAPPSPGRLLILIDPPFERPDDADQAVGLSARVLRRNAAAVIAVWVPIKDLTGFDALLTAYRDGTVPAPMMVAEVRLRPLSDPMKMNGCALIVINPPAGLDEDALAAAEWIAAHIGEPGGMGRVERIAM